jgi:hypothetical protein
LQPEGTRPATPVSTPIMRTLIAILCLAVCPVFAEPAETLLKKAEAARISRDVSLHRKLLLDALNASPDLEERVQAERELAKVEWRNDANPAAARRRLEAIRELPGQCDTFVLLSRIETAAGSYDAARAAARLALERARSIPERRAAAEMLAQAFTDEIFERELYSGQTPKDLNTAALREAIATLKPMVLDSPGFLSSSRLLFDLALLAEDGPLAWTAWCSYFHVGTSDSAPPLIRPAAATLERLLSTWPGKQASPEQRRALVQALGGTYFYTEAALLALRAGVPEAELVVEYARFMNRVEKGLNEYYRLHSLGKAGTAELNARLAELAGTAGKLFDLKQPRSGAGFIEVVELVTAKFNARVRLAETELYYGHALADERIVIEQYGRKAAVSYSNWDLFVTTGYLTWAWDARPTPAGYAAEGQFWQIRPGMVGDAAQQAAFLFDPEERSRIERQLVESTARDESLAAANPYAFLHGLRLRLQKRGREAILARVRARGVKEKKLRLAFVEEYERVRNAGNLVAHEGRHALDLAMPGQKFTPEELEYRGKLSQVIFSEISGVQMGGIFMANIDDPKDGHGKANARLMRDIVAWMTKHAAEIQGLDPAKPLLPQFDKLTDDQMRALFRSLDPLAAVVDSRPAA